MSDILDRKELARQMAIKRTKPAARKSLASDKSDPSLRGPYGRNPNMIRVTGDEAGGYEISPSTVSIMAFIFIGAVVCLHLFGKNIPYGVHPSMLSTAMKGEADL